MADLDKLINIEGAMAAFSFSSKGELQESRINTDSEMDDTILDLIAHVCVANTSIATMQARGWENVTGSGGFYPIKGFSLIGFDWTVIANEEAGIIMPNDKVDYEAAYAALGA
jgi:roadblock/LC7 domain-containing protein